MERAFARETNQVMRKPHAWAWSVGTLTVVCLGMLVWVIILEVRLRDARQHLDRIEKLSQHDQSTFETIDEMLKTQNKASTSLDQIQREMRKQIELLYKEVREIRLKSENSK